MKIILQHDERDCGAACLAMIAAHYQLFLPISRCRELSKTDRTGTNLYGLTDGAKQIGLDADALSGSPDDLTAGIQSGEIPFPFIAHTVSEDAMLHYIVVFGQKNGAFIVGDPGRGKLVLSPDAFFERWTGYVVTFRKTDAFQTGNYTRGGFVKFFRLLQGQWGRLAGILMISLLISGIGICGALVFQIVIDDFALTQGYYEEHDHDHDHAEAGETHTDAAEAGEAPIETEHDPDHAGEHDHTGESALVQALENFSDFISGRFHLIFVSLLCLYLLRAAIQFFRGWLIIQVFRKVDLRLTLRYYFQIVDLPISSLSVRQTGEYLSRFSDSASIRQAISGATVTLLMDSLMAVAGGVILFLESPRLFGISLGMVLVYAILVLLYRKPVEQSNRKVMEEDARLQSYFKETIDGMETVKAADAGGQIKDAADRKFNRFLDALVKSSLIAVSQDTLAGTVELIGTVLILWMGFAMVLAGQITIGTLITFYVLLSYFTEPVKNLIGLQPTIQTALVAADRLNDILELQTETEQEKPRDVPSSPLAALPLENRAKEKENAMPPLLREGAWEARHVDFRYGNRELTLRDVNFTVRKGERVAIVGESGSGKTTLAKLFMRFFEPENGGIYLDGQNIQSFDLSALRREIAYVGQNTFLFSDSIQNNLTLGNPDLPQEILDRACEVSHAAEFIQQLPMGYDMPLDENGLNLSGGQRQRLAIARALARRPKLLILDEATSNLDTVTENAIRDTVFQLDREIACVVIAHRLTTIRSCDRIYVMKDGAVVETGAYAELMAAKGEFYRLWNAMDRL